MQLLSEVDGGCGRADRAHRGVLLVGRCCAGVWDEASAEKRKHRVQGKGYERQWEEGGEGEGQQLGCGLDMDSLSRGRDTWSGLFLDGWDHL